jgi:hypothetical protein
MFHHGKCGGMGDVQVLNRMDGQLCVVVVFNSSCYESKCIFEDCVNSDLVLQFIYCWAGTFYLCQYDQYFSFLASNE